MKCFICESNCEYFCSMNYHSTAFCAVALDAGLYNVELFKCKHCGSVFSKTHQEMEENKFISLMDKGHRFWENIKNKIFGNNITEFPIGTAPHLQEALYIYIYTMA